MSTVPITQLNICTCFEVARLSHKSQVQVKCERYQFSGSDDALKSKEAPVLGVALEF